MLIIKDPKRFSIWPNISDSRMGGGGGTGIEKSENSKKNILTHVSGPQGNLKQLFFVLTQSQKSLPA
jgi:hypothetical protein